jgi:hypothetical protein
MKYHHAKPIDPSKRPEPRGAPWLPDGETPYPVDLVRDQRDLTPRRGATGPSVPIVRQDTSAPVVPEAQPMPVFHPFIRHG